MYHAIILKYSKKKLVVADQYIKELQYKVVENYKFGVKKVDDYTIFYSPNAQNDPNFGVNQNLRQEFDEHNDGYYLANILRTFGEYFPWYFHLILSVWW